MSKPTALVLGSGIIGLTSAITLQRAGYAVTIWTRERALNTTSSVAAAFWFPYRAEPAAAVTAWGDATFQTLLAHADDPASGVLMRPALMLFEHPAELPPWHATVHNFRQLPAAETPSGYRAAYTFTTSMIEMPRYLPYLEQQFHANGGRIIERTVTHIDEATSTASLVINCTGLGSYSLLSDHELTPIRGQIIRVAGPPVDTIIFTEGDLEWPTYIVPRAHDCILGGTANEGDWNLSPEPSIAADIRFRCAELAPATAAAPVLQHLVGLRPGRSSIRLEAERQPNGALVIHNYGHGGAGVTLSWGCASAVLTLVQAHA